MPKVSPERQAWGVSTVVDHSAADPEIKGSNPGENREGKNRHRQKVVWANFQL